MEKIISLGRILFAIAITAFGVENLICARFGEALTPVIPWVPGIPLLAYITGAALLAAGVSILINVRAKLAAILLGIFFFACTVILLVPRAAAQPLDVSIRTIVFEALAMCGSAWTLAGMLPSGGSSSLEQGRAAQLMIKLGPLLFALCSVIFGIDHFLVLGVIASLVPAWIPGPLFWAYFTGAGFIVAGICIATRWMGYWGAAALGLMFLLWFLLLHAPRVMTYPRSHNPDEWSSAFIALAMCGGSWICAWPSLREVR